MKYTVDITETALQDMDEIYDYISFTFKAPDTAAAQYDRIADEILSLEEMPLRYGIPQFEPLYPILSCFLEKLTCSFSSLWESISYFDVFW